MPRRGAHLPASQLSNHPVTVARRAREHALTCHALAVHRAESADRSALSRALHRLRRNPGYAARLAAQRSAEWVLHYEDNEEYQDEVPTDDDDHHNQDDDDGRRPQPRLGRAPARITRDLVLYLRTLHEVGRASLVTTEMALAALPHDVSLPGWSTLTASSPLTRPAAAAPLGTLLT
ncbi:MAG: hypothetical protein M1826_000829 [Phylliscum demangeonii]|nr:MAG: hypothetical protein M1826_000829 [Phylliscum demangeonii]